MLQGEIAAVGVCDCEAGVSITVAVCSTNAGLRRSSDTTSEKIVIF